MATPESQADAVRAAISGHSASASTVTTLQSLLRASPQDETSRPASGPGAPKPSTSRTTTTRTAKSTRPTKAAAVKGKDGGKADKIKVLEDEARSLPPKGRYALATDVINASLKVLTEATKSKKQSKSESRRTSSVKIQATPRRTADISQRALQIRSGNATPTQQSPAKQNGKRPPDLRCSTVGSACHAEHVLPTAECSRVAFSYLRAVDAKKLGVKEWPRFQLENGMLSLSSMLIGLGFDSLATRELSALRRRLRSVLPGPKDPTPPKPTAATTETSVKSGNAADLLDLNLDIGACTEARPLLASYHLYVLRLLTAIQNPAATERSLRFLSLDSPASAVYFALQWERENALDVKAAKHVESLSQVILQLCPSVSESADACAKDRSRSLAPLSAFELQSTALYLRCEAWKSSGRDINLDKDVAEPFSKCLQALVRRSSTGSNTSATFEVCHREAERLDILQQAGSDGSGAGFSTAMLLSVLAERASSLDHARKMAELAMQHCRMLDQSHLRHLSAIARRLSISLVLQESCDANSCPDLEVLNQGLQGSITGSSLDYDVLLSELSHLLQLIRQHTDTREVVASQRQFAGLVAGFASRCARKFPTRHLEVSQDIVCIALAFCGSHDDATTWINKDMAQVMIQSGVARAVAKKASSNSMHLSWSALNRGISFARILKVLTVKALASDPDKCTNLLIDEEAADPDERGAMLERQLKCQSDVAHKAKYHDALKKLLPETLRRLAGVYDAKRYPIRRARVLATAMRIREEFPILLSPHILSNFSNEPPNDGDDLGMDEGLRSYLADVRTSLDISRAFAAGPPSVKDLQGHLQCWEDTLKAVNDRPSLELAVDSPHGLIAQLVAVDEYLEMLGEDELRVPVSRMLVSACKYYESKSLQLSSLVRLSRIYIQLGYAEKAIEHLNRSRGLLDNLPSCQLEKLDYEVCHAEHLFAIGQLDACGQALRETSQIRAQMQSQKLTSSQVTPFRLLQARGWLLYSRHSLTTGASADSLHAAKRANKILNSVWTSLERSGPQLGPDLDPVTSTVEDRTTVDDLMSKVSKLDLKAGQRTPTQRSKSGATKGARFWSAARLLCSSSLHLCDVYVHHGIFAEANYASEQAMKIAESLRASRLLHRIQSHRATLLAMSGLMDDAELCLAKEDDWIVPRASLATFERLRALSILGVKQNNLEHSYEDLEQAEAIARALQSQRHVGLVEAFSKAGGGNGELPSDDKTSHPADSGVKQPNPKGANKARGTTSKARQRPTATLAVPQASQTGAATYSTLQRLENTVSLEKAAIGLRIGRANIKDLELVKQAVTSLADTTQRHQYEFDSVMVEARSALQADFSLNVLPESTLAYPALLDADRRLSSLPEPCALTTFRPTKQVGKAAATTKAPKFKSVGQSLESLLVAARRCLFLEPSASQLLSTSETHRHYAQLCSVSVMLSATSMKLATSMLHPVQEAFTAERARVHASQCQRVGALAERDAHDNQDSMAWPGKLVSLPGPAATVATFQSDYIDILPASWTVVSLCLDEKCDELYVARYHRSEAPFLLRLPFSRQKSEDADEEVFDFHAGKAELSEIIELSNYSCHNAADPSAKGAKTSWWNQRELLDKRMQELLLNIESLWLGGFKGVFSQRRKDEAQLSRFRKAFEALLDRHLPSRKSAKRGSKKFELDDHILELFIGLAKDLENDEDLDEPIADLLYFVVDIFQFNGERNAYDEVDFDSMGIEVQDALRAYNDAVESDATDDGHLILVLDRRLQAFPWESLPCLEKCSISRVDSMLSIRERILQMRQSSGLEAEQHCVERSSGTYIVNPASDLKATEATLVPELAKLHEQGNHQWTSIVRREPSEKEFQEALQSSSMLLYFGHGAGSQYIRPRAVKRLESCSEVVWLMGCSSGAATEYGDLEPFSVPLTYLTAGLERMTQTELESPNKQPQQPGRKCMAVVGMLWDVTDKDIDRFSLAVGEEWGLWKPAPEATKLPAKTPRKRGKTTAAAPSTPEKTAKTPKTPKVRKTPAPARTPARSRSRARQGEAKKQSLSAAVARSRESCYLRYLNGAAPVVYGVPVYLGD